MNMELLERLGTDFTLREISAFPERSFGSGSKRANEAPESRAIAKLDSTKLLKGAAGAAALALLGGAIYDGVQVHEKANHQRDLS